jgi:hypothetical protein
VIRKIALTALAGGQLSLPSMMQWPTACSKMLSALTGRVIPKAEKIFALI